MSLVWLQINITIAQQPKRSRRFAIQHFTKQVEKWETVQQIFVENILAERSGRFFVSFDFTSIFDKIFKIDFCSNSASRFSTLDLGKHFLKITSAMYQSIPYLIQI